MELPPQNLKGTYALLFELQAPLEIQVGRLGFCTLPAGFSIYVGSAFGPGGLHARLARHLRIDKRRHWHIDALTMVLSPQGWWWDSSAQRLECEWIRRLLASPQTFVPVPGFGSSDCQSGCPAHLVAFPPGVKPDLSIELRQPNRKQLVGD